MNLWDRLLSVLRVENGVTFGMARPIEWTGYDKSMIRPVDKKFPISATYGPMGPQWNWHMDAQGKWVAGQKYGVGQHKGYDFACPIGTPVYACVDGIVEASGHESQENPKQGFGIRIRQTFKGPDGTIWRFYYGHLSETKVQVGSPIKAGDLIALSGNTGHTTGAHLHVEARDPSNQQHPIEFKEV